MRLALFLFTASLCSAQVIASFSDQGKDVVKRITGQAAAKGTTVLAVDVCNAGLAPVTVPTALVFTAISNQSRQKPALFDPSLVSLVLTSYGQTGKLARATALSQSISQSGAILIAAKAITASAPWGIGLQLGTQLISNYTQSHIPPTSNLINLGQILLHGDLVLAPKGTKGSCENGMAIAATAVPLQSETVIVN